MYSTINVDDVLNKGEDVTSEVSKDTDDKEPLEPVGILNKHGISLGPVLQEDNIGLKCPVLKTVSNNNELQTNEITYEYADKVRKTFRQLQRMMRRKVEVRTHKISRTLKFYYV